MNTKSKSINSKLAFKKEAFSARQEPLPIKPNKSAQDHEKQKENLLTRLWIGIKKIFEPLKNWSTKKKDKGQIQDSVPYEDFNPTAQDIVAHQRTSHLLNISKHMLYEQSKNPKKQSIKNLRHKKSITTDQAKHSMSKKKLQQKNQANKPINKTAKITVQKSSSSQYSTNLNK